MTILAILNTAMTFGILVGVWWGVLASHNGDIKEVAKALREFIGKNFDRDKT